MRYWWRKIKARNAQVAVLTAVSLVPVLGAVAFVTDGGLLLEQRRRVQATADAAALAAAYELYRYYSLYSGLDANGEAQRAALYVAERAGYSSANGSTVEVYIPPRTGLGAGKPGYAEVRIRVPQPRAFSAIFGSQELSIAARSVARARWNALTAGLIVLAPDGRATLNLVGNAQAEIRNAPVYVNSSHSAAGVAVGNGTITAPTFYFSGSPGYTTVGSATFNGNIYSGQVPIPDPLAYLPPPDPSSLTIRSARPLRLSGRGSVTLLPGVYIGGISIAGDVNVTFMPGIYYLQGGGLQVTGKGDITGQKVLIYNDPRSPSDDINIAGLGKVEITAPDSGAYQGIAFYQRRDATNTITISGNAQTKIQGAYYLAKGTMRFVGNGTGDILASQVVASQVAISGNGQVIVDWVERNVARTRAIGLVE